MKRKLAKHAMAEEDIVYPMLQGRPGDVEHIRQMYREHGEIKVHLFEVEQLLKSGADWAAPVRSLRAMISSHARDGEENEFPKLRADVTDHRTLAGQIRRKEAMVL